MDITKDFVNVPSKSNANNERFFQERWDNNTERDRKLFYNAGYALMAFEAAAFVLNKHAPGAEMEAAQAMLRKRKDVAEQVLRIINKRHLGDFVIEEENQNEFGTIISNINNVVGKNITS